MKRIATVFGVWVMWCVSLASAQADVGAAAGIDSRSVLAGAEADAVAIVLKASRSDDPNERAHAIEAMAPADDRLLPLAQLGVADPNRVVRYRALVAMGQLKLPGLGQVARQYVDDPSPSVRAAAIFAAYQCGQQVNVSAMAPLLANPSPIVRANVASLIGQMGEPSAIGLLHEMARTPMRRANVAENLVVQVTIAKAVVDLGDLEMLDVIRAQAYSDLVEIRVMSIDMLGQLRDAVFRPAFVQMLQDQTLEVRLAAATTLTRLGAQEGIKHLQQGAVFQAQDVAIASREALKQAQDPRVRLRFTQLLEDPRTQAQVAAAVRAQSAYGLGFASDVTSAGRLVKLLKDPDATVRLAAAAAVLRALHPAKP